MKCIIKESDKSFFEPDEQGFRKMPMFGRGVQTWYRLKDNGHDWHENGEFSRYSIKKSWVDEDDNERYYSGAPLCDTNAEHLLSGGRLVVDEDTIVLDKRFNI